MNEICNFRDNIVAAAAVKDEMFDAIKKRYLFYKALFFVGFDFLYYVSGRQVRSPYLFRNI